MTYEGFGVSIKDSTGSNENDALDDWRNGGRHIFSLVMAFQDEFSFLRCLERECRKIDQLVFDETTSSALQSSRPGAPNTGIDAYDLSYFTESPQRWSVKFNAWHANPFVTERSRKDTGMERLVATETENFALLESLQEALDDSTELWDERGAPSIDIRDGIKARIRALSSLKESSGGLLPAANDYNIAGL